MKSHVICLAVFALLSCGTAFGQEGAGQAPPTETIAPNLPGIVAGGTKVEVFKIAGTGNTEGPVAMPDGSVLFAELAANRIWKIDKDNRVSSFLENTSGALGLGFDSKGRLIAALTTPAGKTRIGMIYPQGQETVLTDTCDDKPLGRPNDLVVDRKGGVYFTDPGPNARQLKAGYTPAEPGVCYVPPGGGKSVRIDDIMGRPNGIQLSPDEKTLYVNNSYGEYVIAFDLQPDGTARGRRDFGKYELVPTTAVATGPVSVSDGMTVDAEGRVYVANQSVRGVQVFSPQGQHLGTIPLGGSPQNLAFGGPDKKTLYVTGGGYAYKIRMLAQGKDRAK